MHDFLFPDLGSNIYYVSFGVVLWCWNNEIVRNNGGSDTTKDEDETTNI